MKPAPCEIHCPPLRPKRTKGACMHMYVKKKINGIVFPYKDSVHTDFLVEL